MPGWRKTMTAFAAPALPLLQGCGTWRQGQGQEQGYRQEQYRQEQVQGPQRTAAAVAVLGGKVSAPLTTPTRR
jgi:hypothetical protein